MKENTKRIIACIVVAVIVIVNVGLIVTFNTTPDGTPTKGEPTNYEDMIAKYGTDYIDVDDGVFSGYGYEKEWCGVPGIIKFYFGDGIAHIGWEPKDTIKPNKKAMLFHKYNKLLEKKGYKPIEDNGLCKTYKDAGEGWIARYEVSVENNFECMWGVSVL